MNNESCITWTFDYALSTFFEIDTAAIHQLLPEPIRPVEIFPGIGLVNLTAFNFIAGSLNGTLPEFQELIFSVVVTPDLSRSIPHFAMYVLSLASTDKDHLRHGADFYQLPANTLVKKAAISYTDTLSAHFSNDEGDILFMNHCASHLSFESGIRHFQVYTMNREQLHIADCFIDGEFCEHQNVAACARFSNHFFYRDIAMHHLNPEPYMQMICKPREHGRQHYSQPRSWPK